MMCNVAEDMCDDEEDERFVSGRFAHYKRDNRLPEALFVSLPYLCSFIISVFILLCLL